MTGSSRRSLVDLYFRISPDRFHLLKFLLEGYDNLAVLSSVPERYGIVRIKCGRESVPELMLLLASISVQIRQPTLAEGAGGAGS